MTGIRITRVGAGGDGAVGVDGGLGAVLSDDDDDGAVTGKGVEGDGVGPGAGEIDILIAALGGNRDAGGVLGSVVADGLLHIGDGHVLTFHIEFSQCLQCLREGFVVEAEVAVGRRAILVGDGLADGAQVMLHVHLYHLEDGLTDAGLGAVVRTGGHGGSGTGVGLAVEGVIRDTVDGTGTFAANADLFDLSHFCKILNC